MVFKKIIQNISNQLGYQIQKIETKPRLDLTKEYFTIWKEVKPYTLTTQTRVFTLIDAIKYLIKNNVLGAICECGVWRGGSMMAVAKALSNMNVSDRELYLFDTFEGMTEPSDFDIDFMGRKASRLLKEIPKIKNQRNIWVYSPLDDVKKVLYSTGYDKNKIHFIKGRVEETIPSKAPDNISLLRLDTDWYESTKHELIHLFPRLSKGGVVIIDDYGYFEGAKKAVDEYLLENRIKILLNRIDEDARIGVKL